MLEKSNGLEVLGPGKHMTAAALAGKLFAYLI